jgi:ElaB/YqjD/DUF883 family membrane-anchored ribosome-binding protein
MTPASAPAPSQTYAAAPVASPHHSPAPADSSNPARIEADIERTRAEMGQTINAISDRLEPAVLKEYAKEIIREAGDQARGLINDAGTQAKGLIHTAKDQASEAVHDATIGRVENMFNNVERQVSGTGSSVVDMVRQNPIPAAMIAMGIGWLFMNNRGQQAHHESRRDYRYQAPQSYSGRVYVPTGAENYGATGQYHGQGHSTTTHQHDVEFRDKRSSGDLTGRAREMAGDVADQAQRFVGDVGDQAQRVVGNVTGQAQDTAYQAQNLAGDMAGRAQETFADAAEQARYQAWLARSGFERFLDDNPLAVGAIALGVGAAIGFFTPSTRYEGELMGEARERIVEKAQETFVEAKSQVQDTVQEVVADVTKSDGPMGTNATPRHEPATGSMPTGSTAASSMPTGSARSSTSNTGNI